MELFRRIELWQYVADHRIYAAAATGIIFGIALTIAFKFGGSSGGSDIIALSIQKKYSATNIAWFILLVDIVVAIASLFVFKENGLEPLFLSLTYLVVMTKTMEMFDDGMHSAIKVEIVTAKPDELAEALMKEMHRGVTSIKVKGMYTHAEKSMLVCIIGKRQLTPLKKLIRKIDPNAFAYTSTATEVLGAGFIPRG